MQVVVELFKMAAHIICSTFHSRYTMAGLSPRAGDREFPLAAMSMTPGHFESKYKESRR